MHRAHSQALSVATAILVAAGCSSDKLPSSAATIGMEGGTAELGEEVEVVIPPGALPGDEEIELEEIPPTSVTTAPEGTTFSDDVFAMTPHGLVFTQPVTVSIAYSGGDVNRVVLRLDDESDTTWGLVSGATFANGKATFETMTFSVYGVAEAEPCVEDDGDPTPDAALPTVDAGVPPSMVKRQFTGFCPCEDLGDPGPIPDAGTPIVDAGTPMVDAGNPPSSRVRRVEGCPDTPPLPTIDAGTIPDAAVPPSAT